jgi:hypothetical protein
VNSNLFFIHSNLPRRKEQLKIKKERQNRPRRYYSEKKFRGKK